MDIHPQFPPHRRNDPRRNTEALVYDQLANCDLPGHVLYELKPLPEAPELDFGIWLEDHARYGLQNKGGLYSVDGADWTLRTANGKEQVPCPLAQTWDAAIAVRDVIYRVLGFKVFIIPVLLLPDTPPDSIIEEWAAQRKVKVLFGADNLVDRLLSLADRTGVKHPPTAGHIRNEIDAVTNGLVVPSKAEHDPEPFEEPAVRQLVIQHVDNVNIYVTQAYADGRDPQVLSVR